MKAGRLASPPARKEYAASSEKERNEEAKIDTKENRNSKEKEKDKDKEAKEKDILRESQKEKDRLPVSSSASEIDAEIRSARLERVESAYLRALVADAGQIVKLNVGGTRYFTTKGTLLGRHIGLNATTFFHGLLAGRVSVATDNDGFIFIDRSGSYFEGEWHVDRNLDERVALKEAAFYGLEPKGAIDDDIIVELVDRRSRRRTRDLIEQHRDPVMRIYDYITVHFKRSLDSGEPLIASPMFLPDDPKKLVADHITQYWRGHRVHNQAVQQIDKLTRQLTESFTQHKYVFDTQLHTLLLRASDDVRVYLQQEFRLTTEVKEIVYYMSSVDDDGEHFSASVKTYRDANCSVHVPLFTAIQFIWTGNRANAGRG